MIKPYEGSGSIEYLGYEIISLISKGCKENVDEVINKMWNEEVVRYILNKYKDKLIYLKDVSIYGIDDWKKIFFEQSGLSFNSNAHRQMGIENRETDGLLFLLYLILETVAQREFE